MGAKGPRPRGWWSVPRTAGVVVFGTCAALFAVTTLVRPPRSFEYEDAWDRVSSSGAAYSLTEYAELWGAAVVREGHNTNSSAPLPTVAACARIRNEARYLREWLEFHRLVGVTSFYIFDDASDDATREILAPYEASGLALVWPISETPCPKHRGNAPCADRERDAAHGEHGFRDECLRVNPHRADWILMTDVDEFAYPANFETLPEHLASTQCDARVAYLLVRWHVFGSAGRRRRPTTGTSSIEAYRERGREDDRACSPRLTCGDETSPPVCAKVLARAKCVTRQGTHYVVDVANHDDDDCVDIYEGARKLARPRADDAFAARQHERCAALIHLNHYAVRSREDFVDKFARGRISSGARDARLGLADAATRTRDVGRKDVAAFLDDLDASDAAMKRSARKRATGATSRADLMLVEFARRDHSEILDDTALRYAPALRERLAVDVRRTRPVLIEPESVRTRAVSGARDSTTWACPSTDASVATRLGLGSSHHRSSNISTSIGDATALEEASRAWLETWRSAERYAAARPASTTARRRRRGGDDAGAYHRSALFAHIPKTAGTTLNLVLEAVANRERLGEFCLLNFVNLDSPRHRKDAATRCGLISAETDVSILSALGTSPPPSVALVTFLRDPLARVASQYEHHLASGRLARHATHGDIVRVVSPRLCPQLERDAAQCATLAHPRKCKAGGWCALFQNHQTHVLAGAEHVSKDARMAARRSAENLLCVAKRALGAIPAVGLTERLEASLCVVFDTLGYGTVYGECCRAPGDVARCDLFGMRADKHSAADRAASKGFFFRARSSSIAKADATTRSPKNASSSSSYLDKYLEDDVLRAAMYEGNALDCELYALGVDLLKLRLGNLAARKRGAAAVLADTFRPDDLLQHCFAAARSYHRLSSRPIVYDGVEPFVFAAPSAIRVR